MKLIVACDPNGGIGYENGLPWSKIQGDLPRFKELTTGHVVIMGRNTWDSLPKKPLPKRENIVIASNLDGLDSVITSSNPNEIDKLYPDSWLIGGAMLINSCWPLIDEIHLTKTFTEYTCDTFIDLIQLESNYSLISTEQFEDHEYQIWRKK
jgi:dihydrofolate reductase